MSTMWWLPFISLLLLANSTFGLKYVKVHKINKANNKSGNIINESFPKNRIKRSLNSDVEKIFMPMNTKLTDYNLEDKDEKINADLEQPFWGMRGRRESSEEDSNDLDYNSRQSHLRENCKNCYKILFDNTGKEEEILSPFWGNRGRRNSDEIEDNALPDNPFWGNRGRREEEEPFWGTRGRRKQELPLWSNRGRQEKMQLKNKKKIDMKMFKNRDDTEPFWGNRGRRKVGMEREIHHLLREEIEPFWGSRGRRENKEPFWGNRGKRKDYNTNGIIEKQSDQFRENIERRKEILKEYIIDAMNKIEDNIDKFSRLQRSENIKIPFWLNRGRENKLQNLFKGVFGNRLPNKLSSMGTTENFNLNFKPSEPRTVLDDRIFAEQPHYILVERSSRSSAEEDPFFISRGKKFSIDNYAKIRDRRGAIEELVKSVRNDPYYIARGKKFADIKNYNSLPSKDKSVNAVELICSTVALLPVKEESDHKEKKEIKDNERDRRNTLKKLAAQLQDDPYFVSRGKKNGPSGTNSENIEEFINQIAAMCD